jgi:hypothetical protein
MNKKPIVLNFGRFQQIPNWDSLDLGDWQLPPGAQSGTAGQVLVSQGGGVAAWGDTLTWSTEANYYISPTGSDTTGDGSVVNPYYSPHKVIEVTQLQAIQPTSFIRILAQPGTYDALPPAYLNHPYGRQITIEGQVTMSVGEVTSTSYDPPSGEDWGTLHVTLQLPVIPPSIGVGTYCQIFDISTSIDYTSDYLLGTWVVESISDPDVTLSRRTYSNTPPAVGTEGFITFFLTLFELNMGPLIVSPTYAINARNLAVKGGMPGINGWEVGRNVNLGLTTCIFVELDIGLFMEDGGFLTSSNVGYYACNTGIWARTASVKATRNFCNGCPTGVFLESSMAYMQDARYLQNQKGLRARQTSIGSETSLVGGNSEGGVEATAGSAVDMSIVKNFDPPTGIGIYAGSGSLILVSGYETYPLPGQTGAPYFDPQVDVADTTTLSYITSSE